MIRLIKNCKNRAYCIRKQGL